MNSLVDFIHVRLCLSNVVASHKALGSQTGHLLTQACAFISCLLVMLEHPGAELHKHLMCNKAAQLDKIRCLWAGWAGPWVGGKGWGDGIQAWPRKYLAADQRHLLHVRIHGPVPRYSEFQQQRCRGRKNLRDDHASQLFLLITIYSWLLWDIRW
ncbi:hypothetical protein R1flu_022226 [Riccia fluitans]|uniref:Uncharacterized protein n=1 Tax=Riccia fluitans TaxID=41844 RepID=A0ABD1ZRM7_9MARC